jgi:hypothetical protein
MADIELYKCYKAIEIMMLTIQLQCCPLEASQGIEKSDKWGEKLCDQTKSRKMARLG